MSNALTLPNALRPASAKAVSAGSLTLASHSMLPGHLGNIDAYIQAVNRIPLLSAEEERQYATEYREQNNLDAARRSCCRTCGSSCRSRATTSATACRTAI